DVIALVVQPAAAGEQVFAAIEFRKSTSIFFVRVWSLSTGAEVPTWRSAIGPTVLQDSWEWSHGKESVNNFEPALALDGYYRTKRLYGMTAFDFEGRTVAALAGPHGEVRVMDARTLRELTVWTGGESTYYINSLVGGIVGGVPYVFGGDERGVLFRGGI